MSPKLNGMLKTIGAKAGEVAAISMILGFVGVLWVDRLVEDRMNELLPDPAANPTVVTHTSDIQHLKNGQVRIESKVDTFSREFMAYLARQAQ